MGGRTVLTISSHIKNPYRPSFIGGNMTNIIKKREVPFTQVPNCILTDSNISLKAKGLYCYLLSKPDEWEFHTECILEEIKEGETAFYSAIKELIDAGYIIRYQKNENGKFSGTVYEFIDVWNQKTPCSENLDTENKNTLTYNYNNKYINNKYNNNLSVANKKIDEEQISLYKDADRIIHRLQDILTKHYQRMFPARGWKEQVVKLMKLDKVPAERIFKALDWYEEHIGETYTPVVQSGRSLREKFGNLENAMNRVETWVF